MSQLAEYEVGEMRKLMPDGTSRVIFSIMVAEDEVPSWVKPEGPSKRSQGRKVFYGAERTDLYTLVEDLEKSGFSIAKVSRTTTDVERHPDGERVRLAIEFVRGKVDGPRLTDSQIEEAKQLLVGGYYTTALYFNADGSVVFACMSRVKLLVNQDIHPVWVLFFTAGRIELLAYEGE
jgi:hypothetical protein